MDVRTAFSSLGLKGHEPLLDAENAYRRLRSQWHPDRNKTEAAHERMTQINRAIEVLREEIPLRVATGRFSQDAQDRAERNAYADVDAFTRAYEDFMRGTHPQAHAAHVRGPDVRRTVKLSMHEAAFGCTKVIRGSVRDTCPECQGMRHKTAPCAKCRGKNSYLCRSCRGSGLSSISCSACGRTGKAATTRDWAVEITVPPGTAQHGITIAKGLGGRGGGGGADGDLVITFEVLAHEPFYLDPEDGRLHVRVPVSVFTWIAGGPLHVPTLDGFAMATLVPRGMQARIEDKGWPAQGRRPAGPLIVDLEPVFPETLSDAQREALRSLDDSLQDRELRHWVDRMKNWSDPATRWARAGGTRAKAGR